MAIQSRVDSIEEKHGNEIDEPTFAWTRSVSTKGSGIWLGVLAATILLLPTEQGLASTQKKILRAGVVLRHQDRFNQTVQYLRQGVDLARILYERDHSDIRIQLKDYTHTQKLETLVAVADEIIKDEMAAVIGTERSDEAIALGDRLAPSGVNLVTPTASNPKVTEGKPGVFRVCFEDSQVADRLAEFVLSKFSPKAVGVLHVTSTPYSNYLSTRFSERFSEIIKSRSSSAQIPLVVRKVLADRTNFDSEIQAFKDAGVTHVISLTYLSDFSQFVLQASQAGLFPVYFGSDGWGSNENVFDDLVKGNPSRQQFVAYRNSYWKEDSKAAPSTRFRREFEKKFKTSPNGLNAIAFDAAWVLFSAMRQAKNPASKDEVREQLKKVTLDSLVTAQKFSFGVGNAPKKELHIYKIGSAGIQYEATLP